MENLSVFSKHWNVSVHFFQALEKTASGNAVAFQGLEVCRAPQKLLGSVYEP